MDDKLTGINRQTQIGELLEVWKEKVYHSTKIYKERTTKWYNQQTKPKEIREGDQVLLLDSRINLFRHGKLQTKWLGPYTVINTSSQDAIIIKDDEGKISKVNGQHLKVFLEPNKLDEEIDMIEFKPFYDLT